MLGNSRLQDEKKKMVGKEKIAGSVKEDTQMGRRYPKKKKNEFLRKNSL